MSSRPLDRKCLGLLAVFLFLPFSLEATERSIYALILGYNQSTDSELKDLRYADDDAVKNAALMREQGAEIFLHTELDAESQRLYPDLKPLAPTLDDFMVSWNIMRAKMQGDRREGKQPVLYVFLSGHGDVAHNEGFLYVKNGRFTRQKLLKALAVTTASAQHLIIDACKSYFMVFRRGPGGRREALAGTLELEHETLLGQTGVMLSTSSDAMSHEWEAYQAGVFSHQLRSALRGAADQDGDGKVTYMEASSFVWNAQRSIRNPKFRSHFFSYQPKDPEARRAGLWELPKDKLTLGPGWQGHIYIEDGQGERLLDFHPSSDQTLNLSLPSQRPLFLRKARGSQELALYDIHLKSIGREVPWKTSSIGQRGGEHEAFSQQFALAFDDGAAAAFISDLSREIDEARHGERAWQARHTWLGVAGLSLGIGLYAEQKARETRRSINAMTSQYDVSKRNQKIQDYRNWAHWGVGLAVASVGAYTYWTWSEDAQVLIYSNLLEPQIAFEKKF